MNDDRFPNHSKCLEESTDFVWSRFAHAKDEEIFVVIDKAVKYIKDNMDEFTEHGKFKPVVFITEERVWGVGIPDVFKPLMKFEDESLYIHQSIFHNHWGISKKAHRFHLYELPDQ